jgi:hypothetical protein
MGKHTPKEWTLRRSARSFKLAYSEYLSLIETSKRCQKCKTWKIKEEFPADNSRYDGLSVKCYSCIRINRPPRLHKFTPQERERALKKVRGNKFCVGRKISDEHKELLRSLRIKEGKNGSGNFYGSNNPNWKGGITTEIRMARSIPAYKRWRTAVFKRDNYMCCRCGDNRGGNLHAHHIKKFADFPGLRYKVSNGETLCFDCHVKEHDVPNSYRKRRYARHKKVA